MKWISVFGAWAIIALQSVTSFGYFVNGDWKRGVLWFAWMIANIMVYFI